MIKLYILTKAHDEGIECDTILDHPMFFRLLELYSCHQQLGVERALMKIFYQGRAAGREGKRVDLVEIGHLAAMGSL